nr:sucrose synthase [Ipomoea batatas]
MAERVLTRVHSLREHLDATLTAHRKEILLFMSKIESHGKGILKPHQLLAGVWEYVRVNVNALVVEELTVPEYLHFKEELVDGPANGNFVLELDFEPFTASFPKPTLTKSIGNGVEFLNRHLSAKMFHDKESMTPLLDFLRVHEYKGKSMMLNDRIQNLTTLQNVLSDQVWSFIPKPQLLKLRSTLWLSFGTIEVRSFAADL